MNNEDTEISLGITISMALLGITIRPSTKTITGHSLHSGMSVQQSIALPRLGRDTASIASILSRISREYKVAIDHRKSYFHVSRLLYEIIWVCLGLSSGNGVLAIFIGKYREISGNYSVETLETLPFIEKHTAWRNEGRSVVSVADCFSATAWNRIQASQPTRRYKWAIAAIWSEISTVRAEYSSAGSCSDFFQLLSGWWLLCTNRSNSFLGRWQVVSHRDC